MSLKIFTRKDLPECYEVIMDVEIGFLKFELLDSELNKNAIRCIESGSYLDNDSFIDRFGHKLYKRFLSSGCKAALCVINLTDNIINTAECGINALSFIVDNCKEGMIVIEDTYVSLPDNDIIIDVEVEGKKFNSIKDLNEYLV